MANSGIQDCVGKITLWSQAEKAAGAIYKRSF